MLLANGELRCKSCGKLLARNGEGTNSVEIKCARCGTLNTAFEAMTEQVIVTDAEGTILYANEATMQVTGYGPEEVIGAKPSLWGGQMPPEFYKDLWRTIKDEKKSVGVMVTNKRKDGTRYEAHLMISPVMGAGGEILFFVGIEKMNGGGGRGAA